MTNLEIAKRRIPVLLAIGLFLQSMSTAYLNDSLYPGIANFFPYAREIATAFGAFSYAAIAWVAMVRPRLLQFNRINIALIIALLCSAVPTVYCINHSLPVLSTVLLCVRAAGSAWATTLLAIAASSIASKRILATVLIIGTGGAGLAARMLVSHSPFWLEWTAPVIFPLIVIALLYKQNKTKRAAITRRKTALDRGLIQPFPLKTLALVIGFILLFGVTQGFSLAIGVLENTPFPAESLTVVFLILLLIPKNTKDLEDNLFVLSSLLMVSGYLVFAAGLTFISANSFLSTSREVFDIVVWMMVAMVGRKNILQQIPFLAIARVVSLVGLSIGTTIGHISNGFAPSLPSVYSIVASCILLVFIVYLVLGIRRPLFAATLARLDAFEDSGLSESEGPVNPGWQELAEESGLTKREYEVFDLLAQGRNSVYIQEKLVISKNTTKTHIKHIYQKLGVHSHQELLDMLARTR